MSKSFQEIKLQDIADAIREVSGTTHEIPAKDFACEIRNMQVNEPVTSEITGLANVPTGGWTQHGNSLYRHAWAQTTVLDVINTNTNARTQITGLQPAHTQGFEIHGNMLYRRTRTALDSPHTTVLDVINTTTNTRLQITGLVSGTMFNWHRHGNMLYRVMGGNTVHSVIDIINTTNHQRTQMTGMLNTTTSGWIEAGVNLYRMTATSTTTWDAIDTSLAARFQITGLQAGSLSAQSLLHGNFLYRAGNVSATVDVVNTTNRVRSMITNFSADRNFSGWTASGHHLYRHVSGSSPAAVYYAINTNNNSVVTINAGGQSAENFTGWHVTGNLLFRCSNQSFWHLPVINSRSNTLTLITRSFSTPCTNFEEFGGIVIPTSGIPVDELDTFSTAWLGVDDEIWFSGTHLAFWNIVGNRLYRRSGINDASNVTDTWSLPETWRNSQITAPSGVVSTNFAVVGNFLIGVSTGGTRCLVINATNNAFTTITFDSSMRMNNWTHHGNFLYGQNSQEASGAVRVVNLRALERLFS